MASAFYPVASILFAVAWFLRELILSAKIEKLRNVVHKLCLAESVGNWTETQAEIGQWGEETFPGKTSYSVARHLQEEAGELTDDVVAGNMAGARMECADVVILALGFAHHNGFDLRKAVGEKMHVNRFRDWSRPDREGVVRHVREPYEKCDQVRGVEA